MKFYLFLINVGVLFACTLSRQDVVGKYINDYEPEAEHYVELRENGSFRHVYNGPLGHFVNSGAWGFDDGDHTVHFRDWQSFGKQADPHCTGGCASSVDFDGDELYFSHDEPEEMNFYKE